MKLRRASSLIVVMGFGGTGASPPQLFPFWLFAPSWEGEEEVSNAASNLCRQRGRGISLEFSGVFIIVLTLLEQ